MDPVQCNICLEEFSSLWKLLKHKQKDHPTRETASPLGKRKGAAKSKEEPPVKSSTKESSFKSKEVPRAKSSMKEEKNLAKEGANADTQPLDEQEIACPACKKPMKTAWGLRSHLNSACPNLEPQPSRPENFDRHEVVCPDCNYVALSQWGYDIHRRRYCPNKENYWGIKPKDIEQED